MEENKEEKPAINNKAEKMSYEQLENIAHQLSEQNKKMYLSLQEATMTNMFKRLDYLFKILEQSTHFGSQYVFKCAEEIKTLMTIPEENSAKESN